VDELQVRTARDSDVPALRTLTLGLSGWLDENWAPTEEFLHGYLRSERTGCLVAHDNSLLGMVAYSVLPLMLYSANHGIVEALFVAEQVRGSGIGSALLAAAEADMQLRGCTAFSLTTARSNKQAIAFYHERGYSREYLLLEKHAADL